MIDTHTHIDGEEFNADRPEAILRAQQAGVTKLFLPAIHYDSCLDILDVCRQYPGICFPMLGLHPEEVRADWQDHLSKIRRLLDDNLSAPASLSRCIAIGEVGLDYYWSREFEHEQLEAFEQQIQWSIETRLPLMIHCRKAQNEMVRLLRRYERELPGGVFHCFTGNEHEAEELLAFDRFVLGIGGVLTFKKSNLPQTLPAVVPLSRIVLETDSPYMAPVPHRGKRNESSFVPLVCQRLADAYATTTEEVERITDENVRRVFGI